MMRKQIWKLPTKKWVENVATGLWHSRPRTKPEIEDMREAISDMTLVPKEEIIWNGTHHQFTVMRP